MELGVPASHTMLQFSQLGLQQLPQGLQFKFMGALLGGKHLAQRLDFAQSSLQLPLLFDISCEIVLTFILNLLVEL